MKKHKHYSLLVTHWKKVETTYVLGNLNKDYLDTLRYIDIFHGNNENIKAQLALIIDNSEDLSYALYKHSHKSINVFEYLLFTQDLSNTRVRDMALTIAKSIERYLEDIKHAYQALNPLTFYHVHLVELLLFGLRYSLVIGLVSGMFIYWFGAIIGIYDILGVNTLALAFSLAGSNLRHSHVGISFGDTIERFLISLKQHQIHHSKDHRHVNFGGSLAIWNCIFNSLALSGHIDGLKFSIKRDEVKHFRCLHQLIFHPFYSLFLLFKSK